MIDRVIESLNAFSTSVAVMVAFFVLEYILSLALKKKVFEFSDTIANTINGIIERIVYILFAFIYFGAFDFVYNKYHLFEIPVAWWSIALLFIAVDFLWYLYHRAGHVINIFWAAHITHHQSEEYNLTLSFRVSSIQLFIRIFFWMFLPLLGFDPMTTTIVIGINAAYQFFIHTRLINRLGFLEHIIVTPSHHRVHHGKNPQYIDKNYGGIFIIWDKLFGTFEKEVEEVQYGITKPLNSYNPFQAWFHYFVDLFRAAKQKKTFGEKLKLMLAGPESMGEYYESLPQEEYKPNVLNSSLKWYLGLQFSLLCYLCIMMFKWYGTHLNDIEMGVLFVFVSLAGISITGVLENKKFSLYTEYARVLLTGALIAYSERFFPFLPLQIIGAVYFLVFTIWLVKLKGKLFNY